MRRDRPLIYVRVRGRKKDSETIDITDQIKEFRYEDEERKADRCEITLNNQTLSHFDNPIWKKGSVLEVSWGYPGFMTPPRTVLIKKIRGGVDLRIEAEGPEMALHKSKETKVHEGKTLYQLAEEMQKELQVVFGESETFAGNLASSLLRPGISLEAQKIKLKAAHQAAQTKANFLAGLARRYGYIFYYDYNGFSFRPRDEVFKLQPHKSLSWFHGDGEWMDFEYENDWAGKEDKVSAVGVDPEKNKVIEGKGSNDDTARNGAGERIEEWSQRTGQALEKFVDVFASKNVQAKYAAAKERMAKASASMSEIIQKNGEDRTPFSGTSEANAKQAADGKYKRKAGAAHQLRGRVVGDPHFLAKTMLKVEGIGRRLSGNWLCKRVAHLVDQGGYTCQFEAERDADNGYGEAGEAQQQQSKAVKPTASKDQPIEMWNQRTGEETLETFNPDEPRR